MRAVQYFLASNTFNEIGKKFIWIIHLFYRIFAIYDFETEISFFSLYLLIA